MHEPRVHTEAGFTLVEVLVALAVAAILALTLIGGQRQSLNLASSALATWDHLNFSQELLAANPPQKQETEYADWVAWPEREGAEWRFYKEVETITFEHEADFAHGFDDMARQAETQSMLEDGLPEVQKRIFQTRVHGTTMSWEWYGLAE